MLTRERRISMIDLVLCGKWPVLPVDMCVDSFYIFELRFSSAFIINHWEG